MGELGFAELIARVRDGDEDASRLLVESYGPEVQVMVRRHLPARLRRQFDTMDFAQAVWSSVIVDCRERPEGFDGPGHLLGFLASVVKNKVNGEYRRQTRTQKYDIKKEEPIYVRQGDRELLRDVAAADPTPSENVQADDRLDQLLAGRSPLEVRIVHLKRDGLTFDQIGERVGLHEKAVRRVIDALRDRLEARGWR